MHLPAGPDALSSTDPLGERHETCASISSLTANVWRVLACAATCAGGASGCIFHNTEHWKCNDQSAIHRLSQCIQSSCFNPTYDSFLKSATHISHQPPNTKQLSSRHISMNASSPSTSSSAPASPALSTSAILGASIGAAFVICVIALVYIWNRRPDLPSLDREARSGTTTSRTTTTLRTANSELESPIVVIGQQVHGEAGYSPLPTFSGALALPGQAHSRADSRTDPFSPDLTVTPFVLPLPSTSRAPSTTKRPYPFRGLEHLQRPSPARSNTSPPYSPSNPIWTPQDDGPAYPRALPPSPASLHPISRTPLAIPRDVRASWLPDERPELMDRDAFAVHMGEVLDSSPTATDNPFAPPPIITTSFHPFSVPNTPADEQRLIVQPPSALRAPSPPSIGTSTVGAVIDMYSTFGVPRRDRTSITPSVESGPPPYDALSIRRPSYRTNA